MVHGTCPMKISWKGVMGWTHSSHSNGSFVSNTAGDGLQRIQNVVSIFQLYKEALGDVNHGASTLCLT